MLTALNQQLSTDADNLARALKGESKTQGNWGEFQLELLLEQCGFREGLHYKMQPACQDAEGRRKQPDCILYLPDDKCLIVDAKVSLTAYERYFHAKDDVEKQRFGKEHTQSMLRHIKTLSHKQYDTLYGIHAPDYVFMFVPLESALALAHQEAVDVFEQALRQNVVLVSGTTLLATLRTIAFIWRQEDQRKNVREIALQSGKLYDKFVGFVKDMQDIGMRVQQAQVAYDTAMKKLSESPRKADTLVGRAEHIRKLGAETTKRIPQDMLSGGGEGSDI